MKRRALGVVLCASVCAWLAACTTPTPGLTDAIMDNVTPAAAAKLLQGRFDNAAQFTAAPAELKRPPAPGYPYDWIDVQFATFMRVSAPLIGPDTVYVEWRRADGSISRQRLWSFRTDPGGGVRMDYFSFRNPQAFASGDQAAAFAALTPEALIGYGPDCALYVASRAPHAGWMGVIEASQCQITGAASGRRMGLEVRLSVRPDGLSYEEAGLLPDGGFAFKVPGGRAYEMTRR